MFSPTTHALNLNSRIDFNRLYNAPKIEYLGLARLCSLQNHALAGP